MAEWKEASFQSIWPASGDALVGAADALASSVGPLLETAADATRLVAAFLTDLAAFDPAAALVTALAQFKEDFLGSGIKYLDMWDLPLLELDYQAATAVDAPRDLAAVVAQGTRLFEAEDGVSGSFDFFLRKIALSLQDQADLSRPTSAGSVAGFVLCVGGPTPTFVRDAMANVLKLFPTRQEIQRVVDLLDRRLSLDPVGVTRLSSSRPPDWQDSTLVEWFPGLVDVLAILDRYVAAMTPTLNASSAVLRAASALADKAARLVAQVQQLNEALASFLEVLAATGIYVAYAHTGRGVLDWVAQIQQATARPAFAEQGDSYVAGCAFVVETVGVGTFSALFEPAFG